jgi:flagellar hook-associated protein 1
MEEFSMRSTFHGLETARRGMFTQQTALQTTAHNIANASTPGYSRQRVNFVQTEPYPAPALNRPEIPGQLGTGVKAGTIQRVREAFLDKQYWTENNRVGYWEARNDALKKMEEIMNEPSEDGLAKTMDRFWQSLQDLANNPEDSGARSVVRQRGRALAETFNYFDSSLRSIQRDFNNQVDVTVKQINTIATQINEINKKIAEVEPHGYLPNDLYDERDRLLDQLSNLVNFTTTPVSSGGNALDIAEGRLTVEIVDSLGNKYTLVDGGTLTTNTVAVNYNGGNQLVDDITINGVSMVPVNLVSGKLKGLIEAYGYNDMGTPKGIYPEMLQKLDDLVNAFVTEFNAQHQAGGDLNGNPGIDFFDPAGLTAGTMAINPALDIEDIAASKFPNPHPGDGSNALELAAVRDRLTIGGLSTTFNSYYEGVIGEMGVYAQEAVRMQNNSEELRQSVEQQRQSVSGVSLDEEMTNMIQFQHAYNASARMITTIDEMLDRIINNMGIVGR